MYHFLLQIYVRLFWITLTLEISFTYQVNIVKTLRADLHFNHESNQDCFKVIETDWQINISQTWEVAPERVPITEPARIIRECIYKVNYPSGKG